MTLLFSDIEGSTALVQSIGDAAYADVLAVHHGIVRDVLASRAGREEDNPGDGFFATFTSPSAGLAAAYDIERAIADYDWPRGVDLRVRIGIHVGEASSTSVGLVGYEIHRAARIASVGHGGQILLSATAAGLVESNLDPAWTLRDLGSHRLKDLGRPETIFQLVAPGLRDTFAPLRSLDSPELPNNLPASLSTFVGRAVDVAGVVAAVERSRLVTLTGAGGAGKTRLALQAAAEMLDGSGDGVWLIELAPISDPANVAATVLGVFGTSPNVGESPTEAMVRTLRSQDLLLILDNCEHVIDEVARLANLVVSQCPRVGLLATSREPLGLAGEEVVRVPSMTVPGRDARDVEDVTGFESVDLFLARVRAHDQGFTLSDVDAALVASICRRLDGIPLAIELAAARSSSMSLTDLHDRLDERFRLLTGGSRNVLPRQQTLSATVAWSYQLLTSAERSVLCRLTVFVDGFDLAAAEAICATGDVERWDVDALLASLVDKSLVNIDRQGSRFRYRLLETIRQFAVERLLDENPQNIVEARDRHAAYFLALAEDGEPFLLRGGTAEWFERFALEWGNLKAATQHLIDSSRDADAAHLLARLWILLNQSWCIDSRGLVSQLLEDGRNISRSDRARLMVALTQAEFHETDHGASRDEDFDRLTGLGRRLLEARVLFRDGGDTLEEAYVIELLLNVFDFFDTPELLSLFERVTELAALTGDPLIEGLATMSRLGIGDGTSSFWEFFLQSGPLIESALRKYREAGSLMFVAMCLYNLGDLAYDDDDLDTAVALTLEATSICREIHNDALLSMTLLNLAKFGAIQGDWQRADVYLAESMRRIRVIGTPVFQSGFAALFAAAIWLSRGDVARAAQLVGAALDFDLERPTRVAFLSRADRRWLDALQESLRERLGAEFERALSKGASLSPEQALDLAAGRRAPSP